MTDESQAVADLKVVRKALIERRRSLAANGARSNQDWANMEGGETKGSDEGFGIKGIQECIEAVDRAIAEEMKVSRPTGVPL